ncbi:MAG: isoprenylcysteine carboxylmethyltransferase family protein [Sphingopyxis sp.]
MYQQEMARFGKSLFVIRGVYIYAFIIIGVVIAWVAKDWGPFADARHDQLWFWASLGVASLGALIRVITSGHAALGTSGRVKAAAEAAELNTTGPYSLVRNPLYVGRILNYTGIAMLSGNWAYGAIVFLLSILIYERVSVYEEEFLIGKFGDAHREWAARVPMLLPRFHGWVTPKYRFWWKRMIWRERQKVFLLGTALFLNWIARMDFTIDAIPAGMWHWVTAYGALAGAFVLTEVMGLLGYYKDMR